MKGQKVNKPYRRRNYYINKKFQSRFIIRFCLLVILACVLFGGLIYFLSLKSTTTSFENSRLIIKSTADYLLPLITLTSIATIIIVGVFMIMVTLFISHKIAGPAYHLEKAVEAVGNGNLSLEVRLRSGDQLRPIADELNDMIKKLNQHVLKIKNMASELNSFADNAEAAREKNNTANIKKTINEINKEIGCFKL